MTSCCWSPSRSSRRARSAATPDGPGPAAFPPGRWVATLGFAYPGKGLEEVVDATAAAARDPRLPEDARPMGVLNLGGAAPGHEDLLTELEVEETGEK